MNDQSFLFQRKAFSRRNFVRGLSTAGAGVVLSSGLWTPALAQEDEKHEVEGEKKEECAVPLPIPHISVAPPPAPVHFFFPGPVDGSKAPTDPTGPHPDGRDPSTITNFEGFIGQVDLNFSGTGTDTETGETSPYEFHTDTRFMKGVFVASDQRRHRGVFAFI